MPYREQLVPYGAGAVVGSVKMVRLTLKYYPSNKIYHQAYIYRKYCVPALA